MAVLRDSTGGLLGTGGDGIAVPTFTGENPTFGHVVEILPDGKILIAGTTTDPAAVLRRSGLPP